MRGLHTLDNMHYLILYVVCEHATSECNCIFFRVCLVGADSLIISKRSIDRVTQKKTNCKKDCMHVHRYYVKQLQAIHGMIIPIKQCNSTYVSNSN